MLRLLRSAVKMNIISVKLPNLQIKLLYVYIGKYIVIYRVQYSLRFQAFTRGTYACGERGTTIPLYQWFKFNNTGQTL